MDDVFKSESKVQAKDVNKLEKNFIEFLEQDETTDADLETVEELKTSIRGYASSMRKIISDFSSSTKSNPKSEGIQFSDTRTSYLINSNQFITRFRICYLTKLISTLLFKFLPFKVLLLAIGFFEP